MKEPDLPDAVSCDAVVLYRLEALERIKKIDAVVSHMADEMAAQRKDIEEIRRVISTKSLLAASAAGDRQLRPGDRLGARYVIVQFIAQGGMGEVYEAIDEGLQGKHIAIKTLLPEIASDPAMRIAFEREILLAREVNHRAVCPTWDLLPLDGPRGPVLCLSMKLLRGEPLSARLRRAGPMTPDAVLPIARQLAAGLDAAHAAGVVHRDFKPGNIFLETAGRQPQAVITDFGLSRLYDSDHTMGGIGHVAGTPGYIAPELLEGRTASPASDVFAFGVVLEEMLGGRHSRRRHASRELSPPTADPLPAPWDRIVGGCLARDPSHRFQSAGEAMALIDGASVTDRALARAPGRSRQRRLATAIAATALAFAGMALYLLPRLEDIVHPLPQHRFVALVAGSVSPNPADAAVLDNILDHMNDRLVRAESRMKNLLVVGPRDLVRDTAGAPKTSRQEDSLAALGANLVLRVSLATSRERLTMDLVDQASMSVLRHLEIRLGTQPGRVPDAAAAAVSRLLGIPDKAESAGVQDELADLSPTVYQLVAAAEELRARPNDTGLDQAIEKYQQVLDAAPHFGQGYARIAEAYTRRFQLQGDPAALAVAESNARLALQYTPESPGAILSQALVYRYSGRTTQALDSLAKVLRLDPGDPEALALEAAAYRDLNRWADEESTWRLIIRLRPNYYRAYADLGSCLYRLGRYEESATAFQQAVQIAPRQALPIRNLGAVYLLLGRKQDAAAAFLKSIDLAPSPRAWMNLGSISFGDGDYRKALGYYQKARDLRLNDDLAWRNIGDCFFVLGNRAGMTENYAKAAAILSDSLKTNPRQGSGWMTLAFYNAKLGRRPEAETALRSAETAGATDVQSQFLKAQALAVLGRRSAAVEVLSDCIRRGLSPVEIKLALDLKDIASDPALFATNLQTKKDISK